MTEVRCIVADPPWMPDDALGKRGAAANYDLLTVDDLCMHPAKFWPDDTFIANDAYLFLWRLASMQEEALRVVRMWGFVPKTEIVWNKLTKNGLPWFGMGHTTRESHETAIVAKRGSPHVLDKGIRDTFSAHVPVDVSTGKYIHSAKPEEFQDLIEKLCDGPRLELFARRERPGWICYGNELPGYKNATCVAEMSTKTPH